ncbi:MAG: BlaI/MecI/CopY family transcriptional regulator [Planctomycetes bacterium]|nr:BlaI/MecI/CopY family transcriptional regulator [Planctomycetota bacterium]
MSRTSSRHPTELELEILKVLWRVGPATVRQVRDELAAVRDLAYTTVMTMMTIMDTKGYVTRVKDGRSFIYEAVYQEQKASRTMLQDVVDRLFGGSTRAVVQHLLETSALDEDELKQIRQIINRKSREKTDPT